MRKLRIRTGMRAARKIFELRLRKADTSRTRVNPTPALEKATAYVTVSIIC